MRKAPSFLSITNTYKQNRIAVLTASVSVFEGSCVFVTNYMLFFRFYSPSSKATKACMYFIRYRGAVDVFVDDFISCLECHCNVSTVKTRVLSCTHQVTRFHPERGWGFLALMNRLERWISGGFWSNDCSVSKVLVRKLMQMAQNSINSNQHQSKKKSYWNTVSNPTRSAHICDIFGQCPNPFDTALLGYWFLQPSELDGPVLVISPQGSTYFLTRYLLGSSWTLRAYINCLQSPSQKVRESIISC